MDLEKDADRFTMQRQVSGIQLDPVINQNREKREVRKEGGAGQMVSSAADKLSL